MTRRIRNSAPAAMRRARALRHSMGQTERLLRRRLRGKVAGFRFRRQYSVDQYVIDFFCYEAMLAVEVDGEQHVSRADRDDQRDENLRARGIVTLRFRTIDIIENLDGVMETIYATCCMRAGRVPFE